MGVGGQHHAPAAFPSGKTRHPFYRRLGRPQDRSGRVRKISPPPGFDPPTVQPVANRYTDCAIPAHRGENTHNVTNGTTIKEKVIEHKMCEGKKHTHFMFNNFFPWKLRRLWHNVVKYCTPGENTDDDIVRRVRFACWINKATDLHSEYETLLAFPW